ncbi:MAG TPA: hypothetical protein VFE13_13200, partial [Caulobacteraceae bacterium]|nr:hypothetical protein [Caulobacteraceae bacterium]
MKDALLEALATSAGLAVRWTDAAGEDRVVAPDTLRHLLEALGVPIEPGAARHPRLRESVPLATGDVGAPIALPPGLPSGRARLWLEDGDTRDVVLRQSKRGLTAPAIDRPGYHRLETSHACTILAIAPRRA